MIIPAQGNDNIIPTAEIGYVNVPIEILKELADIKEILSHLLEVQKYDCKQKYEGNMLAKAIEKPICLQK